MSPTTGEVLIRLRCRGHPAIRATHAKTLEFTADSAITERATCVIGTGARWAPPQPGVIAGPVRLRLAVAGQQVLVHALANPGWQPSRGVIIRRSGNRLPDTLATDSDLGAADLPRGLLGALRDPGQEFEVTVERGGPPGGRPTMVLLATADDPERLPRLLAESAAADLIVAEDAAARALLRAHGLTAPLVFRAGHDAGPAAAAAVTSQIRAARRVLVVAGEALPGRSVLGWLDSPGDLAVEVAGLPPTLAAAAASPSRAPVFVLDDVRPRELRQLVRDAPPAARLVFRTRAGDLPALSRAAGRARPVAAATAVRPGAQHAERVLRLPPGQLAEALPARDPIVCCLDAAPQSAGAGDDAIRRLAAALAREGVPSRVIVSALAGMPGWSRNRAYEFVSGIRSQTGGER